MHATHRSVQSSHGRGGALKTPVANCSPSTKTRRRPTKLASPQDEPPPLRLVRPHDVPAANECRRNHGKKPLAKPHQAVSRVEAIQQLELTHGSARQNARQPLSQNVIDTAEAAEKPCNALARLNVDNPFRPPAWRWEFAERLIEAGRRLSRTQGDALVAKALHFQRAMQAAKTRVEQLQLAEAEPYVFGAWQLFSAGPQDGMRQAVELLILSGADLHVIAEETGIPDRAVQRYEELYFDVRARPPSAITHMVIRPTEPSAAEEAILVAKRELAYFGGVDVALDLIHNAFEKCRPRNPEDLTRQLARDSHATLKLQAALAMRAVNPTDTRSQLQLVRWSMAWHAIERRHRAWREENAATARQLSAGVQEMARNLRPGIRKTFEALPAVAVE